MMTPIGESSFIYVNGRRNIFQGQDNGYTADIINIPEKDAKAFEKGLMKIWEASEEKQKALEKLDESDIKPRLGIKKTKDKGYTLKAKTLPEFVDKQGNVIENVIIIRDGQDNILDHKTQIWNGSKVRYLVGVKPYFISSSNYGLSLKLGGIQVIELVTGGNNSNGGFGVVEGSQSYANNTSPYTPTEYAEDIPF